MTRARRLYEAYANNHPVVHCNRFPLWSELSREQKAEWRRRVRDTDGSPKGPDRNGLDGEAATAGAEGDRPTDAKAPL